jgi:hypothetical protein
MPMFTTLTSLPLNTPEFKARKTRQPLSTAILYYLRIYSGLLAKYFSTVKNSRAYT